MADLYRIKNRTSSIVKFQDIVGEATRIGIYDRITSKRVTTLAPNATIELVGSDRLENSVLQGQLKALIDNGTITVSKVIKTKFEDDFFQYIAGQPWLSDTDNGAITHGGSIVHLNTGVGNANDSVILNTSNFISFSTEKDGELRGLLQTSDHASGGSDYFFGLSSDASLSIMQDDSAGPITEFDGALFYKLQNETTWRALVSNATIQTSIDLGVTWTNGESRELKMTWTDDGTNLTIIFYIDDLPKAEITMALAGLEPMAIAMGAKKSVSFINDVLIVDYVSLEQFK